MRFCFIVERQYLDAEMPLAVARCLEADGHVVDVLEPHAGPTCVSDLYDREDRLPYDAYVLKTLSDGPGLSILAAAGAAGIYTINHWRSIRLVRDKAAVIARARRHGLPVPDTYFLSTPDLLARMPPERYPLVVKPNRGGAGQSVHLVDHPSQLASLLPDLEGGRHLLAQDYVRNEGYDVKLYNTGGEVFAVRWPSPLHGYRPVSPELLPVSPELRRLAVEFGRVFRLGIFGIDVVRSARGWVAVDVNDFPSFHQVPDAASRLAATVVRKTLKRRSQRRAAIEPAEAS